MLINQQTMQMLRIRNCSPAYESQLSQMASSPSSTLSIQSSSSSASCSDDESSTKGKKYIESIESTSTSPMHKKRKLVRSNSWSFSFAL